MCRERKRTHKYVTCLTLSISRLLSTQQKSCKHEDCSHGTNHEDDMTDPYLHELFFSASSSLLVYCTFYELDEEAIYSNLLLTTQYIYITIIHLSASFGWKHMILNTLLPLLKSRTPPPPQFTTLQCKCHRRHNQQGKDLGCFQSIARKPRLLIFSSKLSLVIRSHPLQQAVFLIKDCLDSTLKGFRRFAMIPSGFGVSSSARPSITQHS